MRISSRDFSLESRAMPGADAVDGRHFDGHTAVGRGNTGMLAVQLLLLLLLLRLTTEQSSERVAKLATHSAVDEEVDRIAEQDADVDAERRHAPVLFRHRRHLERVLDNECDQQNGKRKLNQ